jgi:hypothetical protein
MKFEKTRPKPQFHPIVITLETDVEAQALMAALSGVIGHGLDEDFLFKLYGKLDGMYTHAERTFKAVGQIDLRSK